MALVTMDNAEKAADYFGKGLDFGLADGALAKADAQMMAFERTRIAESVKKLYSAHISKALSTKAHTLVMVHADSSQMAHLNQTVTGGKELLEETAEMYEKGRGGVLYRIKRKRMDRFRASVMKNLSSHLTTPLGFIPDGGISKLVVSTALSVADRAAGIRRSRKTAYYTQEKAAVAVKLGSTEAQRKSAKWSSKTLEDVGSDLQRNLYKLKQSVHVLQSREQTVNKRIDIISGSGASGSHDMMAVRNALTELSMSFHESLHYVEKVTNMCTLLDAASCEIKAHMDNMLTLLESTEATLTAQGDAFFR